MGTIVYFMKKMWISSDIQLPSFVTVHDDLSMKTLNLMSKQFRMFRTLRYRKFFTEIAMKKNPNLNQFMCVDSVCKKQNVIHTTVI